MPFRGAVPAMPQGKGPYSPVKAGALHQAQCGVESRRCDAMLTIAQTLNPGDVLYAQHTVMRYAYWVESGLLQRRRLSTNEPGGGSPGGDGHEPTVDVGYSGSGQWVGADGPVFARQETVTAVTPVRLLAMEKENVNALDTFGGDAIDPAWRLRGLAIKREWRVAYQLRDLPAQQRLATALAYLVHWAAPAGGGQARSQCPTPVCLDLEDLGQWLGLDIARLEVMLSVLAQAGTLVLRGGRLVSWRPDRLLEHARSTGSPAPPGLEREAPEPMPHIEAA